jgi:uncharacterized protein YbbC (DUF1343 family)
MSFRPTFHKFAGQSCGGVQIHVVDRGTFRPYRTGVALLWTARALAPDAFAWRTEAYEFVKDPPAIDLLCGGDAVRRAVDAQRPLHEILEGFAPFEREFADRRAASLIYRD